MGGGAAKSPEDVKGGTAMADAGDSSFYKQVHRLIAKRLSEESNRRGRERRSYRCIQRLAPCTGDQVPAMSEFREVVCQDLSAGGFSYLCSTPPEADTLAVELGKAPVLIYVTACVVHVSEVRSGGERQFLVGCRFTGRLGPLAEESSKKVEYVAAK
jgi:hypothetical protein